MDFTYGEVLWPHGRLIFPTCAQHSSPRQIKFGHPNHSHDLYRTIRQPLVAHLDAAELSLDHLEEMRCSTRLRTEDILRLKRLFASVSLCLLEDFSATSQKEPALRAARFRRLTT